MPPRAGTAHERPQASPASEALAALARKALGVPVLAIEPMAGGGSTREFWRLRLPEGSVVGMAGKDVEEVGDFLRLTAHLSAHHIPVPQIRAAEESRGLCLLEDLGTHTLADRLRAWRAEAAGAPLALNALHGVTRWLAVIQIRGGQGLDSALGRPPAQLNGEAFRADIQTFLGFYAARRLPEALQPSGAALAELDTLAERLNALPRDHFCYRDFQARNIMWCRRGPGTGEGPVFLDYQGGLNGPLAYDLASLLFSPDTGADAQERFLLLHAYLDALREQGMSVAPEAFLREFLPVALLRRLQALGAYVRIAEVSGKPVYLEKIPRALADLRALLEDDGLALGLPALQHWLGLVARQEPP